MNIEEIPRTILSKVRKGVVIPATPLALDENRNFLPDCQRTLIRYYIDAGVGGIAVGVHSTQFEIRNPDINLFEPVLSACSQYINEWCEKRNTQILKIAGVCGKTEQAIKEARFALGNGYHACLLSLAAFKNDPEKDLLAHCKKIADIMPIIGFYLQPSVGGRKLSFQFWKKFSKITNVLAIKIAPFNRYYTIDVVRAIAETNAENRITLYTGNDDNIIIDLLTEYRIKTSKGEEKKIRIKGGLLGHWAVWTKRAVELLNEIHKITESNESVPLELLSRNIAITESNAAIFDPAHDFAGCIPGIHEVLRRQGILKGIWCLNPKETLSPGQKKEIDRIYKFYPWLTDDDFVKSNLTVWQQE